VTLSVSKEASEPRHGESQLERAPSNERLVQSCAVEPHQHRRNDLLHALLVEMVIGNVVRFTQTNRRSHQDMQQTFEMAFSQRHRNEAEMEFDLLGEEYVPLGAVLNSV
jgi:hypothetical protein